MPYVVGKLFSKVQRTELSAISVYFKGLLAKKTTLQPKISSYKESQQLASALIALMVNAEAKFFVKGLSVI